MHENWNQRGHPLLGMLYLVLEWMHVNGYSEEVAGGSACGFFAPRLTQNEREQSWIRILEARTAPSPTHRLGVLASTDVGVSELVHSVTRAFMAQPHDSPLGILNKMF